MTSLYYIRVILLLIFFLVIVCEYILIFIFNLVIYLIKLRFFINADLRIGFIQKIMPIVYERILQQD